MKNDLGPLARVVLDLLGCPGLPDGFCMPVGIRRLLRGWTSARAGSLRELHLVLATADPDVTLEAVEEVRPCRLHLHITWRRWRPGPDLDTFAPQGGRLAAALATVIGWWKPHGVDVEWTMTWPGAALLVSPPAKPETVMKSNTSLMESFAKEILGVRRRPPVPPRTWLTLAAPEPFAAQRNEVVVGNTALDAFLFNVYPFSLGVRLEEQTSKPGCTELRLTVLRRLKRLELLGPPGLDVAEFRVEGETLDPAPVARWPELYSFNLPWAIKSGEAIRLTCAHARNGEVPLYVNPVLFEACRWVANRHRYDRDFRAGGDAPGSYPNGVKGGRELSHVQPFCLDAGSPLETDASLFARASRMMLGRCLARRSDVTRLVAGYFSGVSRVEWAEDSRPTASLTMPGWPGQVGEVVRVFAPCKDATSADRLRAAISRFLSRHETCGAPLLVEVVPEESHE